MPRKPRDMKRINMYLDSDTIKFLKELAKANKVTYSDIIRDVLRSYMQSYKQHHTATETIKAQGVADARSRLVDINGRRFTS